MVDAGSSSGQNKIIDLPDIFQSLSNKRWTGTLQVLARGRNTYMFWRDGSVQAAKPDVSKIVLGRALFKLGKIDEADLNLALADGGGKKLGKICLELGLVTDGDVREALAFQAREAILDSFTWEGCDARFHPGEPPLATVFQADDLENKLNLTAMGILMEVMRRSDEWEMLKGTIPSLEDIVVSTEVPPAPGAAIPDPTDPPDLRRLLHLVDGYRTVQEVADAAPIVGFEALKKLADLVKEGRLRRLEPVELAKLALELEKDGKVEKALRLYELAEARGVDRVDLSKRIARAYQLIGDTRESLARWLKLASRTEEMGRQDQAIEALSAALAIDPLRVEVQERLAKLLIAGGRGPEAAQQLRELISRLEAQDDKDPKKLVWAHTELLEIEPQDEAALRRCAELHVQAKDKVQALVRFEELAQVLLARSAFDEAIKLYYRTIEIDEECLEGRLGLAQTLAKAGRTEESVKEYRKLADILFRSGLIENSVNWGFLIKVYESIVELEPSSTPAWEWLAKAYHENGQTDLAISRYLGMAKSLEGKDGEEVKAEIVVPLKRVVELAPDRFDVRQQLARAYLETNQVDRGVRAYHDLAVAAHEKGDLAQATEALDEALHADPFHLDSRQQLARMQEEKGDLAAAQQLWKDVGGMCLRAGLFDQASEALKHAVELKANDLVALEELATAEEKRGRLREAASAWARLAEEHKTRENAGYARDYLEHAQKIVAQARAQTQRVRLSSARLPAIGGTPSGSSGAIPVPPELRAGDSPSGSYPTKPPPGSARFQGATPAPTQPPVPPQPPQPRR